MLELADFQAIYAQETDPWGLETRWYERRRRALLAASLSRPSYQSGLELGCGPGLVTELLAGRCQRLLAVDAVESAVERTRQRLSGHPSVAVAVMALPGEWPPGSFDLIVTSEILYYFPDPVLGVLLERCLASLEPGGELVAVHWRHRVSRHHLSARAVHNRLRDLPELSVLARHQEADFLLDVFTRVGPGHPGGSVAQRTEVPGAGAAPRGGRP
ncbi:MAG: class I SAM-dependent methyltransferase [Candidatus Dormibacteria bacterium]